MFLQLVNRTFIKIVFCTAMCVSVCLCVRRSNSHLSGRLWRWWRLSLGVKGSSPTLRSGSPRWSCSWSPAAGLWPAPQPTTDRTVGEQSGRCCHTVRTSGHHQNTSCSEGCRWCRPCLHCPWVGTTPEWHRSHWRWRWGSPVQTGDLRGDKGRLLRELRPLARLG